VSCSHGCAASHKLSHKLINIKIKKIFMKKKKTPPDMCRHNCCFVLLLTSLLIRFDIKSMIATREKSRNRTGLFAVVSDRAGFLLSSLYCLFTS